MNFQVFISLVFTALVLENSVLTRALGLNRWTANQNSLNEIAWYSGVFSVVAVITTLGNLGLLSLIGEHPLQRYLRAPAFLICTALVYLGVYYGAQKALPKYSEKICRLLPVTTFNTALFGIFYTIVYRQYSLAATFAYVIGTGLGYALALIILYFAKKRIALCPIPRSFRGSPILMIYIGLLSLAIYGLLGYGTV